MLTSRDLDRLDGLGPSRTRHPHVGSLVGVMCITCRPRGRLAGRNLAHIRRVAPCAGPHDQGRSEGRSSVPMPTNARVTVAVDSEATVDAAAANGIHEVLVDVDVGCLRCGCRPSDAGRLADRARAAGLEVRGVMGYEGQLMMEPGPTRAERVEAAMALLLAAHADVGGGVGSGGGTGTCRENRGGTELQAGSYTLMDTAYGSTDLPFRPALVLWLTVISVHPDGWAVADGGLKALGMDHGDPTVVDHQIVYCSDEHTTFAPGPAGTLPRVGDRVRVLPAHVDPTVAYHERMHLVRDDEVLGTWAVDLRGW